MTEGIPETTVSHIPAAFLNAIAIAKKVGEKLEVAYDDNVLITLKASYD